MSGGSSSSVSGLTVHSWFAASALLTKCIWSAAVAQHQFYIDIKHTVSQLCLHYFSYAVMFVVDGSCCVVHLRFHSLAFCMSILVDLLQWHFLCFFDNILQSETFVN